MLHLRVIVPHEHAEDALGVLRHRVGVAHLVVLPGAAVQPDGDVLEADIARECADDVLADLAKLHIDHTGAITLEALETTLSDSADEAKVAAPGHGEEAVIWDELVSRTAGDSRMNWVYLTFLTLGVMIAAVGVVTNSPVAVVGAMAVAPDFGPLAAFAVGVVGRRWDLVRQSALTTAVGFVVAMAMTTVFVVLLEITGQITLDAPGLRFGAEVDFIYDVGWFSLIVALLAGAAGMMSLLSAKSTALVGVFISVTTVPAAAYAVVAATLGHWSRCLQSLEQLMVNIGGIMAAAAIVLALRVRRDHYAEHRSRPLTKG